MSEALIAIDAARDEHIPTYKLSRRLETYLAHYERLVTDLEAGKDTEKWGKAYERAVMQRDRIRDVALAEADALRLALVTLQETMDVMADDIMCLGYALPREEGPNNG
tara:strand:+ start:2211 stop:2534 length:324 start_codon:yes stop_codon:yes gene_type:complete